MRLPANIGKKFDGSRNSRRKEMNKGSFAYIKIEYPQRTICQYCFQFNYGVEYEQKRNVF